MCQNVMGGFKVFMKFYMLKCEVNIGEAVEQEVKLCDEVETLSQFFIQFNILVTG